MTKRSISYDVIVIGGGPAGMMAAAIAAERGLSVLLLEKNKLLGKKLLITGGGRCNITNNRPRVRDLAAAYGRSDQFLFSMFSQHSVSDSLRYFSDRGLEVKEENEGRLFPVTNTAASVQRVLVDHLKESGAVVKTGQTVESIHKKKEGGFEIKTKTAVLTATSCVVATGGTSRPETGSTGDGFLWLRKLGHSVSKDKRALVPLTVVDQWVKKLGGVSLPDVGVVIAVDGVRHSKTRGKLLFTHVGVSGPVILNISQIVGDLLQSGTVTLSLDLCPDLDSAALRIKLQQLMVQESNKKIKNVLAKLIPTALVNPFLEIADIDGETPTHSVRSHERVTIVARLKSLPMTVSGLLGTDKAVVAGGGVDLKEIHFKTMESRLVPGLYLIGDILNINRPSGGFSLQLCWSSASVAGIHVK